MCEQDHHGVVRCALGWACWKTYVGRPETDVFCSNAMKLLGNGLTAVANYEDALSVQEAAFSLQRRHGASEDTLLDVQNNLAGTYYILGRLEQALSLQRDVYSGYMKLNGEEHIETLGAANNYADSLKDLERYAEAKSLLRETIPVARRVLGEEQNLALRLRWTYAMALFEDPAASLDDQREAVNTLEDTEQIARRVLGGAHPTTELIERSLQNARAMLGAREGDVESIREAVEAMAPGDA